MDTPGVKLICRPSYSLAAEVVGSPFDYPLSSRLDENDAILVFDHALIPWENVLIYADLEKSNTFFPHSGFIPRAMLQGCTRLAVKLDCIAGLLLKAVTITGTKDFYGVQAAVGEVLAWRHLFWGLTEAMARAPVPWAGGAVLPNPERVKLMKLLWDAMGTEFGGRHELYQRNYAGPNDGIRVHTLQAAMATSLADRCVGFAEQCMAEYDLDGWTVPDLITPNDVNLFLKKPRCTSYGEQVCLARGRRASATHLRQHRLGRRAASAIGLLTCAAPQNRLRQR